MSVIDASVFVDAFTRRGRGGAAARSALRGPAPFDVPAIFPAEVTSALRHMLERREISARRARGTRARLRHALRQEHGFAPFAERVWELRSNLSVYDAWYVALAEALGTDLLTADRRLAAARGVRCEVQLVGT